MIVRDGSRELSAAGREEPGGCTGFSFSLRWRAECGGAPRGRQRPRQQGTAEALWSLSLCRPPCAVGMESNPRKPCYAFILLPGVCCHAPALHSPPACLQTYLSSPLLFPSPFSPATFPAPSASCCSALAPCAPDAVVFCWVMGRLVCSPAVIKRQQLSRVQIYIQTSHLGSATHISLCDSFWSSWSWIRLQHIGYNRCTCGSWLHSFSFLSCTFHFSCFHYQTRFCIISTH